MRTWNVHTFDGQYVGQCEALTPEIAFCQCMELSGAKISERDVRATEQRDGSYKVEHNGKLYVLTETHSSPFGVP
ncbi:MAG TPA: hypothetical protein VGO43_01965 [Pyrinomonadaceae bacterium]|jgi:hypothetical protein|nr:hypothetical protein [Pyrinomonadaceae bacterium]